MAANREQRRRAVILQVNSGFFLFFLVLSRKAGKFVPASRDDVMCAASESKQDSSCILFYSLLYLFSSKSSRCRSDLNRPQFGCPGRRRRCRYTRRRSGKVNVVIVTSSRGRQLFRGGSGIFFSCFFWFGDFFYGLFVLLIR